jgi:methyl-accepting chemotaxis protein
VREIAAASAEQSTGAAQVNKAIQQLDQVIQQNASASEEMAATAEELSSQAETLRATISFFKVGETQATRAVRPKHAVPSQQAGHAAATQTSLAHMQRALGSNVARIEFGSNAGGADSRDTEFASY